MNRTIGALLVAALSILVPLSASAAPLDPSALRGHLPPDLTGRTSAQRAHAFRARLSAQHTSPALLAAPRSIDVATSSAAPVASTIPDGSGGVFVCWSEKRNTDYDGTFVFTAYVQRLTSTGEVAFGWPAQGVAVTDAASDSESPLLVSDGGSGVIACVGL